MIPMDEAWAVLKYQSHVDFVGREGGGYFVPGAETKFGVDLTGSLDHIDPEQSWDDYLRHFGKVQAHEATHAAVDDEVENWATQREVESKNKLTDINPNWIEGIMDRRKINAHEFLAATGEDPNASPESVINRWKQHSNVIPSINLRNQALNTYGSPSPEIAHELAFGLPVTSDEDAYGPLADVYKE